MKRGSLSTRRALEAELYTPPDLVAIGLSILVLLKVPEVPVACTDSASGR